MCVLPCVQTQNTHIYTSYQFRQWHASALSVQDPGLVGEKHSLGQVRVARVAPAVWIVVIQPVEEPVVPRRLSPRRRLVGEILHPWRLLERASVHQAVVHIQLQLPHTTCRCLAIVPHL